MVLRNSEEACRQEDIVIVDPSFDSKEACTLEVAALAATCK